MIIDYTSNQKYNIIMILDKLDSSPFIFLSHPPSLGF